MDIIADTPSPPYYAVIFTSVLVAESGGYAQVAERILSIARQQPGFLGYESARRDLQGISVSYWASLEAIQAWRQHPAHLAVQRQADRWYAESRIRVCKVERSY